MSKGPVRFAFLGLLAIVGVSCGSGSSASLSPTAPSSSAPSSSAPSGQTGATIVGQVNSSTAVVASRSTADALGTIGTRATDTSPVSVKVVGTSLSTTTNGLGQFTLNGVPSGEVRLEFTGSGSSATITISGVGPTDEIRIAITLSGSNARLDSEQRRKRDEESSSSTGVELKGLVSGLTGTCPALTFTVQGATVKTSSTTTFEDGRCADLKNGATVEVKGTRQPDSSVAATKVEGKSESSSGTTGVELKGLVSGLTGTCPVLTFTVQGATVKTSSATTFEDGRCTDLKNGATVEVKGTRQPDNSVAATKVEGKGDSTGVELKGLVSGLTGTCPALTLTVQAATVKTSSTTEFGDVRCADLKNGATVEVKGTRQTDGSIAATKVEGKSESSSGTTGVELKGLASGLTGTCPALTFTVQGTTVKTSSTTEFDEVRCADLKNGATVEVKGTRQTDGSVAATKVERD